MNKTYRNFNIVFNNPPAKFTEDGAAFLEFIKNKFN